jgi:CBS domain-containing protein
MLANITLMVFNLLPAFPMDGGRALRGLLKFWMTPVRATQVAATVGQFFALVFGFVGLLVNPMLVLIAIFIWFGASQEASAELIKSTLAGVPVREAAVRDFRTLQAQDSLSDAAHLISAGWQRDFPVVLNDRITGLLTHTDVVNALSEFGPDGKVCDAMQRDIRTVEASEPLETVFTELAQPHAKSALVTESGRLVGLLTADSIAAFLTVHNAMKASERNEHRNAA